MTTVSDAVYETKEHLYGNYKEIINVLSADVDDVQTNIPLADSFNLIATGTLLSVDDELIYVRQATKSLASADVVIRGYRGTTAAAHSEGAIVEIGSMFNNNYLKRLLKQEIASWPNELFQVVQIPLSLTPNTLVYDLDNDDFTYPLALYFDGDNRATVPNGWRIDGTALILADAFNRDATLHVAQKFDLSEFSDSTDFEDDLGMQESMLDIPAYGAAWRAMSTRDAKRSFTESQGEPRKAEEVPPMFQTQFAGTLKRLRDDRIGVESKKLRDKYPYMLMS